MSLIQLKVDSLYLYMLCYHHIKTVFLCVGVFFLNFLFYFKILMLKINFKKLKNIYYFNIFLNKKHFKK
jgi:uncharacterized membrane protein (Fun14 family)